MSLDDEMPPEHGRLDNAVLIIVAPNGARLTKKDHPGLPVTPQEVADCAQACQQAGAAMLHMHARDQSGRHSLDVSINQQYLDAVRSRVGSEMIIQLTTESIGQYAPEQQMRLLRCCRPEAASIALRELVPDETGEAAARDFFAELKEIGTICQFIIYSAEDLHRYYDLLKRQVIAARQHHLLFVIGKHVKASEKALIALLSQFNAEVPWSVCAFSRSEHLLTSAAMSLHGDVRVGFENNIVDMAGHLADSNSVLVKQAATVARALHRPLMTADMFRLKFNSQAMFRECISVQNMPDTEVDPL